MKSSPPQQHDYDLFADPQIPEELRAVASLLHVEWSGKAHFPEVMRLAKVRDEEPILDENGLTKAGKRILSILAQQTYQEKGEEEVLKKLPFLLLVDCSFFLSEPWVRTLMAFWYEHGEADKITSAFFGPRSSGRGKRQGETHIEKFAQAIEVLVFVDALQRQGADVTEREACRQAARSLRGIGVAKARDICGKYKNGDSFLPFFSRTEKTLLILHLTRQARKRESGY